MKLKKIYSIFLLLLIFLCANIGNAEAEQVKIKFWHAAIGDALVYVNELVEEFNETHPNINVEATSIRPSTERRMKVIAASQVGTGPDIFYADVPEIRELVELGLVTPLDDLFPEEFLKQYLDSALQLNSYKNHLYGLPLEGPTWGFFYRKDLFEEVGLDPDTPPKNWEDLVAYAEKLSLDKNGDGKLDQWGLAFPAKAWEVYEYWAPFVYQAGGALTQYDEKEGKLVAAIDSPQAQKGTEFWLSLAKSNSTPNVYELLGSNWEDIANGFLEGKYAMIMDGMWAQMVLGNLDPDKWGTAIMPAGPEGPAVLGFMESTFIHQDSKHKEEAVEFLKWFLKSEYHNKFAEKIKTMSWRKDLVETEYGNDPKTKPFIEAAKYAFAPPPIKSWLAFRDKDLIPVLHAILLGDLSIEEGLTSLRVQLEKQL